jgi:hypothetical protein
MHLMHKSCLCELFLLHLEPVSSSVSCVFCLLGLLPEHRPMDAALAMEIAVSNSSEAQWKLMFQTALSALEIES